MPATILMAVACLLLSIGAQSQCTTGAYWLNGSNANGSLRDTAIVDYFDSVLVVTSPPTSGSFATGPDRPLYVYQGISQWGSQDYETVQVYRGGGHGAKTYFKFLIPKDSGQVHFRILNVRGDGVFCSNCEHQKIVGYRNGTKINATFKALANGASISGDNLQGGSSTTSSVQSEARVFFNSEIDSVMIESVSWNDYVVIELYSRCYSVLPVRWLDFKGRITGNSITLNWSTAAEYGNRKFFVQKMSGYDWVNIGEINGSGNSVTNKNYSFTDRFPFYGQNIYRIRQVNTDGSFSYSGILNLPYSNKDIVVVFPNPARDMVHLSAGSTIRNVSLTTIDGKIIKTIIGNNSYQAHVDLLGTPKGIYFLLIETNDARRSFRKITVE